MSTTSVITGTNANFTLFTGTVWLKKTPSFDAFEWGGQCMRVDGEGTEALGEMAVTHRQNARGGIERDGVLIDPPAEATISLMMKHQQARRKKTELKRCLWIVDERQHCKDKDAFNAWIEITRYCTCKAGERTVSGTGFDPSDEEAMIGFSETCLLVDDVYRVSGEELTF